MTYTLQELSDLEDIRTLKHRYFRGIDTADQTLLGALFTEDLSVHYRGGGYTVKFEGRENMLLLIANSFHSGTVAMHHGHMPDITLSGKDTAEGIWYMEEIFINLEAKYHLIGTSIYRDQYRREDGTWKIAKTEYDRVFEIMFPLADGARIISHLLASKGLQPEERGDISHMVRWEPAV